MSDSWLKNPFDNLSKLINRAMPNKLPVSSTPFEARLCMEPRATPSAPPLPETPIMDEWSVPRSRRFSISEPNMVSQYPDRSVVDNQRRIPRYMRAPGAPLRLRPQEIETESRASDSTTMGLEEGVHPNKVDTPRDEHHGEQVENTQDRIVTDHKPIGGYEGSNKEASASGYHAPTRSILREGEKGVTFDSLPNYLRKGNSLISQGDIGQSKTYERVNRGYSDYHKHYDALGRYATPAAVYDPRHYRDVHYDPEREIEELWRKHISPIGNDSKQSKQPRPMTFTSKPPKFSGQDWESYILQFNSCAIANDWDEEQCVKYLAASLEGDAVYVLAEKPLRVWTFRDLCNALEETYGLTNSAFVNRSKLRRIAQREGQSIQQVADEILKLVRCSFAGSPAEHNRMAVGYFIDALKDDDLKRHLMQEEPDDIRRAVTSARKFQEIQSATRSRVYNPRVNMSEPMQMGMGAWYNEPNIGALQREIATLRMRQAELEHKLSDAEMRARDNIYFNSNNRNFQYNNRGNGNRGRGRGGADNSNWRDKNQQE